MKRLLKEIYHSTLALIHHGHRCECPLCGSHFNRFRPVGLDPHGRKGICWRCGSYERTRMYQLWISRDFEWGDGGLVKVLHIAPEPQMARWLQSIPCIDYVSGDKRADGYTDKYASDVIDLDVTSLPMAASTFDIVICSHVLEHVVDDRQAMNEIRRVMKPGGVAIVQVPIDLDMAATDEEAPGEQLTDEDRIRRFLQVDHLRMYGRDYLDRLRQAGLEPEIVSFSPEDRDRYGLNANEPLLIARAQA